MREKMPILSEAERNKDLKRRKAKTVLRKYKITSADHIPSIKEELNSKMQVKAQRKRRFDKRNKLYRQIIYYREIRKNQVMVKETPPKDNIEKFWKETWGGKKRLVKCLQDG